MEQYDEIERLKEDNDYLNKVNIELSTEKNRLNNIIDDLLKFINDMFDEEAISNSFDMTTKEFIEYIKSKLKVK